MNPSFDRRHFIKNTAIAGLGVTIAGTLVRSARAADVAASSPANRLRVAVIGTTSRGLSHIQSLRGVPGVEIAYICDVDERAVAKGIAEAQKKQNPAPKGEKDFRRILADNSVDAVTIATPDHWHAPMAIMALAAGKHVYVEKPCSHNPREGELLVEAMRKYKRVVQMGNQRRSFPNVQAAIKEIHGGLIGRAYFAKGWYCNNRPAIGHGKPAPVPGWLDYDLWQGPAPRVAYRDNVVHYNWHWFWHWGTGEALNNGTHEMDLGRWALGAEYPIRVSSSGGRYHFQDDWETPDTQMITWDFPNGVSMAWEGRSCNDFPVERSARAVMIYGTNGTVLIDANSYTVYGKDKKVIKEVKQETKASGTDTRSATGEQLDTLHFVNFADSIRNGAKLNSPIEEGHKSVLMLQLGNIAARVGETIHCNAADGHIVNNSEAQKLWARTYEPGWEPKV